MKRILVFLLYVAAMSVPVAAEEFSSAVIFSQSGFPSCDTGVAKPKELAGWLSGAQLVSSDELAGALSDPATQLLILPYGSAFPENKWAEIFSYLQRGGNLLVLGGEPFTRAAYRDGSTWKARNYSVRFTRPLMIDQYQGTPGSGGLRFERNPEQPLGLPQFEWIKAFSPIIRLSAVDLYKRGGAAGSLDARLDALAWGVKDGRKLAAPVIQIDHWRNGFDGGRWIFLSAELTDTFYGDSNSHEIVRGLARSAMQGGVEFTVRPSMPLYLQGEPIQLEITERSGRPSAAQLAVRVTRSSEQSVSDREEITVPAGGPAILHTPSSKGMHTIRAELLEGDRIRATYYSGFWVRDEDYLRSGRRLSVNEDYFEMDGRPLAVVGTTYMSSDVQRLYFEHPNVYVWNRDLDQIHRAGLNMIRSGWWTGWDKLCDENGVPYERTLRTMEAFLMTVRKNDLPIQFNFFAFLPDVLGGVSPYLDPQAIRRQQTLVAAVAARFHDVPWLAWDLINEPSISQHLWTMRPNGDPLELDAWNRWLTERYPDSSMLASAWNVPASVVNGVVPLPEETEFTPRGMYVGHNSLKVYDFFLFAQDVFRHWVENVSTAIRESGSTQLVTVGQDEGGIQDRLSPAFWGKDVSFTTNHSWWQVDYSLWNSIFAKQPGKAMLVQETGVQRDLNLDEVSRRDPENEAALLERKIATSFIGGAGAIEWLWNTNSYMTESNETPIGAVLPDGTEKPEATVMRRYADFAKLLSPHLKSAERPPIAIISSQAAQFSVIADMQLEAQRHAVRALAYYDHLMPYAIAENQIENMGTPQLAILPSPQALTEGAWQSLLKYAAGGGNLLITGPVNRDEHWQLISRTAELNVGAHSEPLLYHNANLALKDRSIPLAFDQQGQGWLDALRFDEGSTFREVPYGKGRIFWAAYPVELAESERGAADLYSYVAGRVGIASPFELQNPISPGVLIYSVSLQDSVLYVMVSDAAEPCRIELRDKLTGVRLSLELSGQRAALALIDKRDKKVIARFGF
jgi:hypothetical protein